MTEEQLKAAHDHSPVVCVAAAPGSGKSTTLIEAVVHEAEIAAGSEDIVLITFTNAAAEVMRRRLPIKVGFVGTLHSYLLKLLRRVTPGLEVVELSEADHILESVAKSLRYKGSQANLIEARQEFWSKPPILGRHNDAQRVILAYVAEMQRQQKVEFDLVLYRGLRLLKLNPPDPQKFFVDEFQDTSDLDMEIYKHMPKNRLFVVGDSSQCIYEFRNANPGIFITLYNHPSTSAHRLTVNFRSTPQICHAANCLISWNKNRIDMAMLSVAESRGVTVPFEAPKTYVCLDVYQHDMKVEELARNAKNVGILCRTNQQVKDLTEFLKNRGMVIEEGRCEVMTIHASKGREFDKVIIAHADEDPKFEPTEEDRRLFYVAITRARYEVVAVCVATRHVPFKGMLFRMPIRFLEEAHFNIEYNASRSPAGHSAIGDR